MVIVRVVMAGVKGYMVDIEAVAGKQRSQNSNTIKRFKRKECPGFGGKSAVESRDAVTRWRISRLGGRLQGTAQAKQRYRSSSPHALHDRVVQDRPGTRALGVRLTGRESDVSRKEGLMR